MIPQRAFPVKERHFRFVQKMALTIGMVAVVVVSAFASMGRPANAAAVTGFRAIFSNVTSGATSNWADASTSPTTGLEFTTTTGIVASATVILTASTSLGLTSLVNGDITLKDNTTALTVGASANGSGQWGWNCGSATVCTLTAPSAGGGLVAGGHTLKIITANNHITNPAAGSYKITLSGSFGDTGILGFTILSSSLSPLSLDATVDPYVTFTSSGNTLHFGTLTTANTSWATTGSGATTETASGITFTLGTNAASGAVMTVNGTALTGTGLSSLTISGGGPTAMATAGTAEQYGLKFTRSGSGGTAIASQFSGNYGFSAGTAVSAVTTASAASATDTITMYAAANILTTTKPGSYSSTLTFVATGTF